MSFWKKKDSQDGLEEGLKSPSADLQSEALTVKSSVLVEGNRSSENRNISAAVEGDLSDKRNSLSSAQQQLLSRHFYEQSPLLDCQDLLSERFGKLRSALGQGTVIQGKLAFDNAVRIDGKLSGEVYSSNALIVGEAGVIDAEIQAETIVVLGLVRGNIKARAKIEILPGGRIEGDVTSPALVVFEGGSIDGQIRRSAPSEAIKAPEIEGLGVSKSSSSKKENQKLSSARGQTEPISRADQVVDKGGLEEVSATEIEGSKSSSAIVQ